MDSFQIETFILRLQDKKKHLNRCDDGTNMELLVNKSLTLNYHRQKLDGIVDVIHF